MKRITFLLVLFMFSTLSLFSLELWINDEFSRFFSLEELKEYAIKDERNGTYTLLFARIIPLFEDVYQIDAYGGRNRITLEEPEGILDTLTLVFTKDTYYLTRYDYRFEKPERIDIYGEISQEKELILLHHEDDLFTKERLEQFCRFHEINFIAISSPDPSKELANRVLQQKSIPHIVVFDEKNTPIINHYIKEKMDYSFSITSLFSSKRVLKRPMDLKQILAETPLSYSWNPYDFSVLSLLQDYYRQGDITVEEATLNGLTLQRSLYEMGILEISKDPSKGTTDFFIENSRNLEMRQVTNYYDFLRPLFSYRCLAVPGERKDTILTQRALSFLTSENTQRLIGREINGWYPAVNSKEYTIPSDPCAILINKYSSNHIRLNYSSELIESIPYWETLSRLALNSSHSLDKLKNMMNIQQSRMSQHD